MEATDQKLTTARAGGKKSAALRKEQADKLTRFRAEVVRRLLAGRAGGDLDPIEEARVDALCGLYVIVIRRCRMSGGVNLRINPLALSAAITSMRSLLRELGLSGGLSGPQDEAPGALAAWLASERGKGTPVDESGALEDDQ